MIRIFDGEKCNIWYFYPPSALAARIQALNADNKNFEPQFCRFSPFLTITTMPKELTHWLLAERVAKRSAMSMNNSPKTSADAELRDVRFSDALLHNEHCRRMLLLGAILHDAPYYTLSFPRDVFVGTQRREAIRLANRLHAASEAVQDADSFAIHDDSFDILRAGLSALAACKAHQILGLQAFLLGLCTHICADCRFHPRIYFVSGNLWQSPTEAWSRHRALESALDLAFCRAYSVNPDKYSLTSILHAEAQHLSALLRLFPPLAPYTDDLLQGYAVLARVRTIGTNTRLQALLDRTEYVLPASLRAYTALRYTKHSFLQTFLDEEADISTQGIYQHPVTGNTHQHSYQQLFDAAEEDSISLWEQLMNAYSTNTRFAVCGASLEHGCLQQSPRAMLYFKGA
ncbi:MAG: hypothetical protein EAZ92_08875 [Candidatus Kapaibacterium sp.]|nr:MAG: hypothetical protein EAZ92_08875 [Candidatus Kapabacteria bacterium]